MKQRLTARRVSRGQSLVEFALVLPLIALIIFGVIDLGRGVFAYNTLSQAARQANRLAIIDQDISRVQAEAVSYAPASGLTIGDVSVCFKAAATLERDCTQPLIDNCVPMRIGCLAIVTVSVSFEPITPLINAIVGSIPLSSTSIGPVEYVCPRTPGGTCP